MTLEKRIAAEVYSYHGQMSVFVDDLQGHTVEIGADERFETASTIKAYILAVLYLQAERGAASLTDTITYRPEHFVDGSGMLRALGVGAALKVKDAATMMIICSDNIATNMVIDYLGLETINRCIRELGFAHTVLHNPLHFDRYDRLGDTTPRDYAALFARLARGQLVSPEASREMLAIFRAQHYNAMLTGGFPPYYLDCEETGDEELHIRVGRAPGAAVACPECGRRCGVYDARERTWRHLDIWQFRTVVHCRVPRADCPEHGPRTVRMRSIFCLISNLIPGTAYP